MDEVSWDAQQRSYQYVSFEEQAGLNGDTDAGLTVSLHITANIRRINLLSTTDNTFNTNSFSCEPLRCMVNGHGPIKMTANCVSYGIWDSKC